MDGTLKELPSDEEHVRALANELGLVHKEDLRRMVAESRRPGGKPVELESPRHRRLVDAIVSHSKYSEERLEYVSPGLLEDVAANVVPDSDPRGETSE